jgi:hypothetical protein
MERIKRAWRGLKWTILRRNVGWAAAVFTALSSLNDCIGAMNGRVPLWLMLFSPLLNFPLYCLFFTMLGLPYYFLRNLVLPPPEDEGAIDSESTHPRSN